VREADRLVTETHARYLELLTQAEQTRQELADCRQAAIFAALYPDSAAGQEPNTALLTGGLRRPVEQTLGVATQLAAERVFQALRLDGDWLKGAATVEQHAKLQGSDPTPRLAQWANTPEGAQADREDKQRKM
jgi:hypothetical protein